MIKDNFVFRVRVVYLVFFLFGALLAGRLFFLQVIKGEHYSERAGRQYIAPSGGYFNRGTIYFKKKDGGLVSAATVKKGYLLAINPKIMKNPESVYLKISAIAEGVDKDDFSRRAAKKNDPYEEIANKLSAEQADKIKNLGIPGVSVFSEAWRFYPAKNLASRILGFVGFNGNKLSGRYGLEKRYQGILARSGDEASVNSFAEIFMGIKKIISGTGEEGDIVLTIDPSAQAFLESSLEGVLKKYKAESAGGLIINPATGAIYAMSAKPDFDPNNYGTAGDLSLFLNPIVQNVFEFGSIMKALTMAAGLDTGAVSPETVYDDKGFVKLNGRRIENYDGKARGRVDMQQVLNQSLNTGAVFVMQKTGKEEFKKYMKAYGFGEKTGIDLPDEVGGLVSNLDSNREVEYATASFGQGIAVSPIEMASALSTLANGGALMRPYVVAEIKVKEGIDRKTEPREIRRVLKPETSEEISRMLVRVVDEALMGGTVKLKNYTIAAKTGTAQLHRENGKGYYKDEYLHSFFGYAPAFNAKFLVLLYLVKPQGVRYASHSLTEPFMNIAKFMINYYDIEPDR